MGAQLSRNPKLAPGRLAWAGPARSRPRLARAIIGQSIATRSTPPLVVSRGWLTDLQGRDYFGNRRTRRYHCATQAPKRGARESAAPSAHQKHRQTHQLARAKLGMLGRRRRRQRRRPGPPVVHRPDRGAGELKQLIDGGRARVAGVTRRRRHLRDEIPQLGVGWAGLPAAACVVGRACSAEINMPQDDCGETFENCGLPPPPDYHCYTITIPPAACAFATATATATIITS